MDTDKDILKLFVGEYLTDKVKYVTAAGGAAMSAAAFLWLIGTRKIFIVFFVLLFFFPMLSVFIWDLYHRWRYYHALTERLSVLNEKTLLHDVMEEADFAEGRFLQRLLVETDLYMNDQIADTQRRMGEYRDYVEAWVHEIKMPIAMLNLLMERLDDSTAVQPDEKQEETNQLKKLVGQELKRLDMLVEQALYYARSTFVAKDFMAESTCLAEMVSEALKENSMTLIHAKAAISMNNLEYEVFADRKWMVFILGQIITNAVKYKKDVFSLSFNGKCEKESVRLEIRDNGIGIAESDMERIFDKGFTGENGRIGTKSTGIGLYLCRKLCEKMNLGIEACSKKGEGTAVTIIFPVGSMVTELM